MVKIQSSLLILSALLCLTSGWETGNQYSYKYVGRSIAGIYKMKQQNAVIELQSRVIVQNIDENTIFVKMTENRIKRNGNYLEDASNVGGEYPEEIHGEEDQILSPEILSTPFVITHNKGSITGIHMGADEPLWIVNIKKSIASQWQLDITGVNHDGPSVNWKSIWEGESTSFTVYEDSMSGDCSNVYDIDRLPWAQVYSMDAYKMGSWDYVCKDKPVYKIVKTKDFNRCKSNPVWASATPATHSCEFGKGNCNDFMHRTAMAEYIACGKSWSDLLIVHVYGFSDVWIQPFATKTDELVNSVITHWSFEKKESISSRFPTPPSPKEHTSLSYVWGDFQQWNQDGTPAQPNMMDAYMKSPFPISVLRKNIIDALRIVSRDLQERPDSEKDNLERLAVIGRVLPMFSFDELKSLWQEVKSMDYVTMGMFVDCVVQSGSNPAVMLIKELVETEQITGEKATWALGALGYFAKTPTRELLHEFMSLLKSHPVQSNKAMMHTTMMTVADLLNAVCGSHFTASKRFPISVMGDFCDSKDSVIKSEFLPWLTKELESSESTVDRIVALSAFGSLGVEEIIPVLWPIIRGTPGKFDDTAERVRAILSLHRVVFTVPEKVHPILASLASSVGERPEVRMASLGLLLMSNATQTLWQKFAGSTWFEPSQQMASFTRNLIESLTKIPATSPLLEQLIQKAKVAWPMVKPAPFGLPYSWGDIRSTHLDEGIAMMMHTPSFRVADEHWPVYMANRYYYQLGPFSTEALSVYLWNYNMGEVWQNIFGKLYGMMTPKEGVREKFEAVKGIWEELNATPRPADKRAGLLHINLMGSVNRFINLEKWEESIPTWMAEAMKYQNKPYEVSVTKYRMLAEYNVRWPTEMGLPMRFLATLPFLLSMQGIVKGDGKGGIKSDINSELSWKLSSEIRVDLPFNGKYIASGVDVRVDSRPPREMTFSYKTPSMIKVTWIPGSKVTDLIYYHVKPYTITRGWSDSATPTLEHDAANLISVNDKPIQRELPLGDRFGINVKLIEKSELTHSDKWSWWQWFKKWDINGWANLGFVPQELQARKYVLRYEPSGTRARAVSAFFQYQYASKSSQNTWIHESGSSQWKTPSEAEIISTNPIAPEFRPVLGRLFKNLESGNAQLLRAGLAAEQKDGTWVNFNTIVGLSKDAWYTKDFTDIQIEKYTSDSSNAPATKEFDYSVCYTAVRNWNNPPAYGFSHDVLHLTDEEKIAFGEKCDKSKIRFTAKATRDEEAAKAAMYSPAGQQCKKDLESGFMYGSPACTEARRMDHTYNNYELSAEADNLTPTATWWINSARQWINHQMYPFTVKHTQGQSNPANRATWTIKRDPLTGASNMTFIRPTETLVAWNVRMEKSHSEWARFSPLTYAYSSIFYPLNAGSNFIAGANTLTSGGVSDAKCYVGPDAVHTYDKAHYNYTINECPHVLLTDCRQETKFAVTAHQGSEGQKIVTVIYGKDVVELDPSGWIVVNGAKSAYKSWEKESRVEIRAPGVKEIKAVIYPIPTGLVMEIRSWNWNWGWGWNWNWASYWNYNWNWMTIKVQGSHVKLSAPKYLRGHACGMCGDFNQEMVGEFMTPQRCAVSTGELMAASFKLKSGGRCTTNDEWSRRVQKETETCESVDQQFHTQLPAWTL